MESGGEHLGAVHLDWQSALMGLPQKLSSSLSELVNLSCCVDLCEVHFMTKEITLNIYCIMFLTLASIHEKVLCI